MLGHGQSVGYASRRGKCTIPTTSAPCSPGADTAYGAAAMYEDPVLARLVLVSTAPLGTSAMSGCGPVSPGCRLAVG